MHLDNGDAQKYNCFSSVIVALFMAILGFLVCDRMILYGEAGMFISVIWFTLRIIQDTG